jgi:hypothetical protein
MPVRSLLRRRLLGVSLLFLGLTPTSARADEVAACVEAYDAAQVLRSAGSLVAARDKLLLCGRDTCPDVVQSSCTTWLDEVERSMPTVVFHVRGPTGDDAVDVTVWIDGDLWSKGFDGRAVAVDPGVHNLRFELGDQSVETRVVIQEGVKNRLISVEFGKPKATDVEPAKAPGVEPTAPVEPVAPTRAAERVTDRAGPPTLVYVLGGVGLVGISAFTAFGMSFDGQYEDLLRCSPGCDPDDVDRASSTRTLAVVSGAIGVVSLGAATVLWLSAPSDARADGLTSASGMSLRLAPGTAMGAWTGRF